MNEIKNFRNVEEATYNDKTLFITYKQGKNNLGTLIDFLKKNNVSYDKIYSERPTLNDVFLELTGKELRD